MSSSVAGWRASHVPGRWPVLMGPSSLVVLDPTTSIDLTVLWEKVVGSASMVDLVTALAAVGPDQSPDLLALFWSSTGMRSLLRGNVRLLDPATAEVVADGAGMLTWREVGLAERDQLEIDLGAGPVGTRGLPLVVGAVRAGALRIESGSGAAVISPQAIAFEETIPPDELADWPARSAARAEDVTPLESSEADPVAAGALWPPMRRAPIAVPASSPPSALPPAVAAPVPASDVAAEDDPDSPLGDGLTRRTSPPTAPEVFDHDRFEMENADTALMAVPPGRPVTAEQEAATRSEHDGAPLVHAAICLSGHPNPPYADRCGLCGAPVPPQTTQLVPRPVLGVLRSPDGSSVRIDRPILVGRAPVSRDDLAEVPELMRVPSPGQDISRTHLLVSPDDWEIRLTDLHSTNGTLIVRPGPGVERLQLQPGEPYAVVVGTVVELGDGVAVLVDGPPRLGS
ncbi:MAG TPA: FHA domain-containing protein [Microlunatus sp.]